MLGATLVRRHPLAHLPWRIMAHVLAVAALELRHPVADFVEVVADDPADDAATLPHRSSRAARGAAHRR